MTCIKARSVEVDVDQECGQAAEYGQPDGAPGRGGGQRPDPQEDGGGGQGKDAGAGVLPAGRQQAQGASVKNWLAWVARRMAFQASGPAAVARAPVRMTAGWRGRARAVRAAPATTADRAAPYRMEAQLSMVGRLL
jgi:hypothetical protein